MENNMILTKDYLLECFEYDNINGILIWKERPEYHFKNIRGQTIFNNQFKGKIAGTKNGNYISIHINRKSYLAHRIIWCIENGNMPDEILDHKNQNGFDNRIDNLRLSDTTHNATNRTPISTNILGTGIHLKRGKYQVQIQYKGNRYNKTFSNHKDALEYSIKIYKNLGFDSNHYENNKNILICQQKINT